MKFRIDQNLPIDSADLLIAAGHDAITVYQQSLGGAPDERIVEVCKDEGRILITADPRSLGHPAQPSVTGVRIHGVAFATTKQTGLA